MWKIILAIEKATLSNNYLLLKKLEILLY